MTDTIPGELWKKPDDLRMAIKPAWFDDFWNCPSSPTLRSLKRSALNGRLPQLSVYHGPPGSGKTLSAYIQACVLSCERVSKDRTTPCGVCPACSVILRGYESWYRRALFEIDAADRDDDGRSTVLKYIDTAMDLTQFRRAGYGARGGKCIVFVDEAHRMSAQQRATLLKKVEQWHNAYLILATTVPEALTVSGDTDTSNPLLSRAELYEFTYPTHEECVNGLTRTAEGVGLQVDAPAAAWMVRKHARAPRNILGELYRLSNHGNLIDATVVVDEYGEEAWLQWSATADETGADDGDEDFQMIG